MKKYLTLALAILLLILLAACGSNEPSSSPPPKNQNAQTDSQLNPSSDPTPEVIAKFDSRSPDMIFHNGIILTMNPDQPQVEAIAIQENLILALGTDDEILGLGVPETQSIDLNGRMLTPGFIDSHSHRLQQRYKWGFSTLEEAVQEALSQGWTGVDELYISQADLDELLAADLRGDLPLRVYSYLLTNDFGGVSMGDWYTNYQPGQQLSPHLRVAGLKVFIDYDSGRELFWTQDELNDLFSRYHAQGWQISTKAISIQSHELALNAFEYALDGETNELYRYRIEHSVGVTDQQMARMADLGIIACIQPGLPGVMSYDPDIYRMAEENGVNNVFRWQDYHQSGVIMVGSPLNPPQAFDEQLLPSHMSPMGLIYRAVTQIGPEDQVPEPWMLEKTLTVEQLLPLLTTNGAYATFEEDLKGSLETGKWADLVILSGNPLTVPIEGLLDIQTLMTMIGGEVVYCREGNEMFCGQESSPVSESAEIIPDGFMDIEVNIHEGSPIKIAVQGPVSGGAANLYPHLWNTVQMAVDDYDLVLGEISIQLMEVDDRCEEGAASEAAKSLIDEHPDIVGVIGPLCSSGALGALPVYHTVNLVNISGSNTREDLSQLFGQTCFNRTILHDEQLNSLGLSEDYLNDYEYIQLFYSRYEDLYGSIPDEVKTYLPYTYDAANLLLKAIEENLVKDDSDTYLLNRSSLAASIRSIQLDGLTGLIIIDENGDRIPNLE
jgi:predicted amidohydrolase YtcJ/predicted small lipoprotein YifL